MIILVLTLTFLLPHASTEAIPIRSRSSYEALPTNGLSIGSINLCSNNYITNSNTVIGISDCGNISFGISLGVGTPPQTFQLVFDTGSNILWLPTTQYNSTGFNITKSTTYSNTAEKMNLTYADGSSASGTYGSDYVSLSSTNINVKTGILWVTQEVDMSLTPPLIGIVGMGFSSTPNFLDSAYQAGEISSPAFALSINETLNGQSTLYYNNIPENIVNSTIMVSQYGSGHWQVEILSVVIGGIDYTSSAANTAIIDSGTTLFYLNSNLYNAIILNFFTVNCSVKISGTAYCPCNQTQSWPTFQFMFAGVQVYIHPSQYMLVLGKNQCTYNFGTLSTVSNILLGDVFMMGYTVTFNKQTQQIGFSGTATNSADPVQLIGAKSYLIGEVVLLGIAICLLILGVIVCVRTHIKKDAMPIPASLMLTERTAMRAGLYNNQYN